MSTGLSNLFQGRNINHVNDKVQYTTTAATATDPISSEWQFRPGVYTPKQFMREIATLVESVIIQLGPDPPGEADTRSILFDGLRSSLSHEGREATLHLADWKSDEPSPITQHILKIGKTLYNYAHEYSEVVAGDPSLTIYSPCEGHRWVPPAGRLLRSHRSSPNLMMLYNEWLHQITCLRDGLIPFENFEDVQLKLIDSSRRGTRPMETARAGFLSHIIRGRLPLEAIVETAKVLTAPGLGPGGYGFQYNHGLVLPASLFSGKRTQLLHFTPTASVNSGPHPVNFETAPSLNQKTDISRFDDQALDSERAKIQTTIASGSSPTGPTHNRLPQLIGTVIQARVLTIDVGNLVQGIDAARPVSGVEAKHKVYDASRVLSSPGVVDNDAEYPVIIKASNEVERLALLRKLEQVGVHWSSYGEPGSETDGNKNAVPRFLIIGTE